MRQRYKAIGQLDYEFEELALDDSDNLYNGSALIVYEYEEGDSSVGDRGGFNWHIEDITLEIGEYKLSINWQQNRDLFRAIEKSIMIKFSEDIYDCIKSNAEL